MARAYGLLGRRSGRPGGARPGIILRPCNQSSPNGIIFDVFHDPAKLFLVPNPVVMGLPLPEGFAGSAQEFVRLLCAKALHRAHKAAGLRHRVNEHMNMVRHDHPGFQPVIVQLNFRERHRVSHDARDFGTLQPRGTGPRLVQVSVQPDERSSARQRRRRVSIPWHGSIQIPGNEQGPAFGLPVGEASLSEAHTRIVGLRWEGSQARKNPGPAGRRPTPRGH